MDDMRKAFEAWTQGGYLLGWDGKRYESETTDGIWMVWQAATLAERDRCAGLCDDNRDSDCFDGSFFASSIADAIRNP